MALSKQAKILTKAQQDAVLAYLTKTRHPVRNRVIFLLSVKAGLRAKEIASLTWAMVTDAEGALADAISLTDAASKGKRGGRTIPLNRDLKSAISNLKLETEQSARRSPFIIVSERATRTSAQSIVNLFSEWYRRLGFVGASSHSGRRTAITAWARRISSVGGSLRDVQLLAGHSALVTTQRYIEASEAATRRVIDF